MCSSALLLSFWRLSDSGYLFYTPLGLIPSFYYAILAFLVSFGNKEVKRETPKIRGRWPGPAAFSLPRSGLCSVFQAEKIAFYSKTMAVYAVYSTQRILIMIAL
jgi:hypothetical protein